MVDMDSVSKEVVSSLRMNGDSGGGEKKKATMMNTKLTSGGGGGRTLEMEGPIFHDDVRKEWVNAMFGVDFFATPNYVPKRTGMGLSRIASYVCYQVRIDPPSSSAVDSKMGVTICRIPLGVYVRGVDVDGEAYAAGIIPGSVLISINHQGVLGDPSHKLLETLWYYEGHCPPPNNNSNSNSSSNSSGGGSKEGGGKRSGPVVLTLIKDGIWYVAILLGQAPFGISWAPCGNFALVQRSYSHAQTAGVQRGCLVAAVNDENLRTMDHEQTATQLRHAFASGQPVTFVGCYTPPNSRSSSSRTTTNTTNHNSKSSVDKTTYRDNGGVRLSRRTTTTTTDEPNLEYGVGSFFTCGTNKSYLPSASTSTNTNNSSSKTKGRSDSIAALAMEVAAGHLMAPTGLKRTLTYTNTPHFKEWVHQMPMPSNPNSTRNYPHFLGVADPRPLQPTTFQSLVHQWHPLSSLIFCGSRHVHGYNEASWIASGGVQGPPTLQAYTDRLVELCGGNVELLQLYALQLVALLSNCDLYHSLLHTSPDQTSQTERTLLQIFQSMLDQALVNDGFCQTLYYLMRSFSATPTTTNKEYDAKKVLGKVQQRLWDQLLLVEEQQPPLVTTTTQPFSFDSSTAAGNGNSASWSDSGKGLSHVETMEDSIVTQMTTEDFGGPESPPKPQPTQPVQQPLPVIITKKKSKRFPFFKSSNSFSSNNSKPVTSPSSSSSKKLHRLRTPTSILKKPMPPQAPLPLTPTTTTTTTIPIHPMRVWLERMSHFITHQLEPICTSILQKLPTSIPQKLLSQHNLASVTTDMRQSLATMQQQQQQQQQSSSNNNNNTILNPFDPLEILRIIPEDSYILPSAHYPLLLSFQSQSRPPRKRKDILYRTHIQVCSLTTKQQHQHHNNSTKFHKSSFLVHAAMSGKIQETHRSTLEPYFGSNTHRWHDGNVMVFDTRSSTGCPRTLTLRLSSLLLDGESPCTELGYAHVDLTKLWNRSSTTVKVGLQSMDPCAFDAHGREWEPTLTGLELELKLTLEQPIIRNNEERRLLLFKHVDDVRQEMLAIQFVQVCDRLLKAAGLDLKLLLYGCMPVGKTSGFMEWVSGVVPLSELCQPQNPNHHHNNHHESTPTQPSVYSSTNGYESLLPSHHPIQQFLRANAYDPDAPYFIAKDVMDNYIKSCAGYCIITYLLGVGDRHLDNLLLHPNGHFLHCDYSFLLGQDPKTYLPLRITEDMVQGMGGLDSDGFSKFFSLAGAAFIALRQHSSVRILLTLLRNVSHSNLPDISQRQPPHDAMAFLRHRFRLDLNEDEALSYIEELILTNVSSKYWMAVDSIHSLGKRF